MGDEREASMDNEQQQSGEEVGSHTHEKLNVMYLIILLRQVYELNESRYKASGPKRKFRSLTR